MLVKHPGGTLAPLAGWQAPLRVITGSLIGTTLVLGKVAGGGGVGAAAGAGGCIGVAAAL
jgi:hypothetical protein